MPSKLPALGLACSLSLVTSVLLQAVQDTPSFRASTRLIEVSVVVTARDHAPVPGLTAADFQIFDDGKPQKVELFSIDARTTAPPAAAASPAGEFTNALGDVGSVTIILFDQLNTPDADRLFARRHVIKFLEGLRSDERVGLYVLDGFGVLRVIHDFTSDTASLVRAIATLRGGASLPIDAAADAARLSAELANLFADGDGDAGTREMQAHFGGGRSVYTIDALESIGHHLSGVQNRKNLIWVTSGFAVHMFNAVGRSAPREINRATRSLSDANVAVYGIDARGLIASFGSNGKVAPPTLSMVQTNQDILHSVAEQTGGRAFVNTNDIQGVIRRAADDAKMTYVLGYYPTDGRWDGRFHHISVKVNRPGVDVRHREGYFAVATASQARSHRTQALTAAVVSPITANGLGLTARVDPVAGRPSEYRLTVGVQPGGIALERRGTESFGAVDVVVAQVRADGAEGRSLEKRIDINVPDDRLPQFQRDGVTVDHTFTLAPTAARLRVVVRDVRTGTVGALGVSRQQLLALPR